MKHRRQQQENTEKMEDTPAANSRYRAGQSNSDRMAMLSAKAPDAGPERLEAAFGLIGAGLLSKAKDESHKTANSAREAEDSRTASAAGSIWTVADGLQQVQTGLRESRFPEVKTQSAEAADLSRSLMGSGIISQEAGQRIVQAAGGYWTMADKVLKESSAKTAEAGKENAANAAMEADTVDQYSLDHQRNWAYCGIATTLMLLRANGMSDEASTARDMDSIASQVYTTGSGTDVDKMAKVLRDRGLEDARSTRNGNMDQLLDTLDKGQPVPFGVIHCEGTVAKINSGGSLRYPNLEAGSEHYKTFGPSGHWVLVTGYEGTRESPTHFIVNDPDMGGQLRTTREQLARMGAGSGNFYQVTQ
jgi:hypothetical protein